MGEGDGHDRGKSQLSILWAILQCLCGPRYCGHCRPRGARALHFPSALRHFCRLRYQRKQMGPVGAPRFSSNRSSLWDVRRKGRCCSWSRGARFSGRVEFANRCMPQSYTHLDLILTEIYIPQKNKKILLQLKFIIWTITKLEFK